MTLFSVYTIDQEHKQYRYGTRERERTNRELYGEYRFVEPTGLEKERRNIPLSYNDLWDAAPGLQI